MCSVLLYQTHFICFLHSLLVAWLKYTSFIASIVLQHYCLINWVNFCSKKKKKITKICVYFIHFIGIPLKSSFFFRINGSRKWKENTILLFSNSICVVFSIRCIELGFENIFYLQFLILIFIFFLFTLFCACEYVW